MSSKGWQVLQAIADKHVDAGAFASIEWAVSVGNNSLVTGRSVGEAYAPLPVDPIYRIYSMTKPIVSVAALRAIKEGKLNLYDRLSQFFPRFSRPIILHPDGSAGQAGEPILIEHLFSHRAGLSYGFNTGCPVGGMYAKDEIIKTTCSLEEFTNILSCYPIAFEPGTEWRYSHATDVLAAVLQQIHGKDIETILRETVLDPLGMTDTAFSVNPLSRDRILPVFGEQDLDKLIPLDPVPNELVLLDIEKTHPSDPGKAVHRGGHGLFSTLSDYLRFSCMLIDGQVEAGEPLISRKMHEFMLCNRIPLDQLPLRIGPLSFDGYGWSLIGRTMIDPGQSLSLAATGEFGWGGAAATFFWVDRAEEMAGVVMTQYLGSSIPIGDELRAAAYAAI